MRSRHRKQVLLLGVVCFALPVLLAWALLMFAPLSEASGQQQWKLDWARPVPSDWQEASRFRPRLRQGFGVDMIVAAHSGSSIQDSPTFSSTLEGERVWSMLQCEVRAGWPFRAVVATLAVEEIAQEMPWTVRRFKQSTHPWQGGIRFGPLPDNPIHSPNIRALRRVLPVRPLWPGLLADAGIVGAVLLTWPVCRAVRGEMRRKRGRCVACGHALLASQLVCSECGSPRKKT